MTSAPSRPSRAPRARLPLRRRLAFGAVVLAVVGVALLAAGEALSRWRATGGLGMPTPYWLADAELIYRPNPAHPETPGGLFRRDAPLPDGRAPEHRVLCIGESSTYGFGLAWDETWTHRAEESLRARGLAVDVLNAAVNGYGSRQWLVRYRRDLRPALDPPADVAVVYLGWNRTGALLDPGEWWPRSVPHASDTWRRSLARVLERHSLLFARLEGLAERFALEQAADEWFPDPLHDVWAADVEQLVRAIQADGTTPLLVLHPPLFPRDATPAEIERFSQRIFAHKRYKPEMLVDAPEKHEALRAIAERTGAPLVDVAAAFAPYRGEERAALFLDEVHPSAEGARLVGRVVADALVPLLTRSRLGSLRFVGRGLLRAPPENHVRLRPLARTCTDDEQVPLGCSSTETRERSPAS